MIDRIAYPSYIYKTETVKDIDNPLAFLSDQLDLKDIVSGLCKTLHHPVALIDYNALMNTDSPEKLESMVEMYPMRRSCSIFRKCAGEYYCTECDRFHARCMGKDKASIRKHIRDNLKQVPDFFYPEYRDRLPNVLEGFDRPVIEYNCPMLGYRELLFPLMYRGSVYGVFFAGQIMVYAENDQKINNTISKSFFDKMESKDIFKDFIDIYNEQDFDVTKLDNERIKELIINSDTKAQPYDDILGFKNTEKKELEYTSKNFRTKEDYYWFIGKVCNEIAKTEKKLSEMYEDRRKRIIFRTLGQIADKYIEKYREVHDHTYKNKHEARTEELKSSWKALEVFASEIKQQFGLVERIILFGNKQGIRIEDANKKEAVFSVPTETKKNKGTFDFSLYSIDGIGDYDDSLDNPKILNGLSDVFPKKNSILIQCHDIAMLILVTELEEHMGLYVPLTDAIGKELVRINNIIALCSANLMKEKYLLTLRMYRHENAHISTRLMGNINRYFSVNDQRFLRVDDEKRQSICNDMKNTVQLISNIADNIGFVTGTGIASKGEVMEASHLDVPDMLYKWQVMFRDLLEHRNLEIKVYRGGYDSSTAGYNIDKCIIERALDDFNQQEDYGIAPRDIIIVARLFELLVYNLVDNAVKYAYRGTNIYLIWIGLENYYELMVTSYGPCMPKGESMYGLYVRGQDERFLEGDGLGLYVVKKIAEKLNIKVDHSSERVSRYNVPLIPWYIKADFSDIKGYTRIEESKLIQKSDFQQIDLAINKYPFTEIKEKDVTPAYLSKRIKMDTWRTTFCIRIPK